MTVIAVRDGVMAVDSLVSADGRCIGEMAKYRVVPEELGGGYIAGSGEIGIVDPALDEFVATGKLKSEPETSFLHLRGDGEVFECENGKGWVHYDAPFYASGSGQTVASAAMMAGASPELAVRIACAMLPGSCGGQIVVLGVK